MYGRTLLQHEPGATTDLLIDLCNGDLGKKPLESTTNLDEVKDSNTTSSGPTALTYLGLNRVQELFGGENQSQGKGIKDGGLTSASEKPGAGIVERKPTANDNSPNTAKVEEIPPYTPPSPTQFFAHFVDHRDHFVRFLEAVADSLWGQSVTNTSPIPTVGKLPNVNGNVSTTDPDDAVESDQREVWNTLLELYLITIQSSDPETAKISRLKALNLLLRSAEIPYDPMHALILCSTSGFTDGLVGLWESMGMYEDVLRFWMDKDKASMSINGQNNTDERLPSDEVLRYLDLYGPTNTHLYPLVLRYLTSSPHILSRHPKQLAQLLSHIDDYHIMPPLAVVQLLSRNSVASVGSVKDWLKAKVEETKQDVESDKHLVDSYRSETKTKQEELRELANPKVPEVFQVTRCAACGGQLDLPSVHFMCKHSYHQRYALSTFPFLQ